MGRIIGSTVVVNVRPLIVEGSLFVGFYMGCK